MPSCVYFSLYFSLILYIHIHTCMQPYRHLCFQADMDVQVVMWLNCLWESLDFITLLPKIIPSVHEHSRFQENDHIQNFNDDKIYLACGSLKYFHCPSNALSLWLPLPTFSIQSNTRSCTRFVETSPPWGAQVLSTPRGGGGIASSARARCGHWPQELQEVWRWLELLFPSNG